MSMFCPRSIHGPRVGWIMSHCSCLSVARIPFCSNEQPSQRLTLSNHDILRRKYFLCSVTIPSTRSTHGVDFHVGPNESKVSLILSFDCLQKFLYPNPLTTEFVSNPDHGADASIFRCNFYHYSTGQSNDFC